MTMTAHTKGCGRNRPDGEKKKRSACMLIEPVDSPNINDDDWGRKSQFQQRDQALPSGEHLRVVTMLSQQAEHFVQRPRRDVIERGWEHPKPPGVNPRNLEDRSAIR